MVDFEKLLIEHKLKEIITALCESSNRCPVCYGEMNGDRCSKCSEYYLHCNCVPLLPKQITDGE